MHYLRTYHARWRFGYFASAILLVMNESFFFLRNIDLFSSKCHL